MPARKPRLGRVLMIRQRLAFRRQRTESKTKTSRLDHRLESPAYDRDDSHNRATYREADVA